MSINTKNYLPFIGIKITTMNFSKKLSDLNKSTYIVPARHLKMRKILSELLMENR